MSCGRSDVVPRNLRMFLLRTMWGNHLSGSGASWWHYRLVYTLTLNLIIMNFQENLIRNIPVHEDIHHDNSIRKVP